jgi:hypothetical protein
LGETTSPGSTLRLVMIAGEGGVQLRVAQLYFGLVAGRFRGSDLRFGRLDLFHRGVDSLQVAPGLFQARLHFVEPRPGRIGMKPHRVPFPLGYHAVFEELIVSLPVPLRVLQGDPCRGNRSLGPLDIGGERLAVYVEKGPLLENGPARPLQIRFGLLFPRPEFRGIEIG